MHGTMHGKDVVTQVRRKYHMLPVEMDERMRRQWASAEARELGWGGVTAVAQAWHFGIGVRTTTTYAS